MMQSANQNPLRGVAVFFTGCQQWIVDQLIMRKLIMTKAHPIQIRKVFRLRQTRWLLSRRLTRSVPLRPDSPSQCPAALYFLEGEADLTLGTDTQAVKAGAFAHMPPYLSHAIVAKTPLVVLLIMMKGRKREKENVGA